MFERDVPVYLITGFLESGKTRFLDFTIRQQYFQIPDLTLLLVCEEGEEEYDPAELKKCNTVMEVIENPEDFTLETLKALDKKYRPERVLIEYNPLWSVAKLYEMTMPRGWDMAQHIVTVDASCFQIYMNNMKSIFMEMIRGADMVIFNRCQPDNPLANFRRSVKVVSPAAEVLFEDENGEIEDIFQDEMPYDMNADVIDIEDIDYGIWYIDSLDSLDRYVGKNIQFTAMVMKPDGYPKDHFIPGRMAMTCCAEDMAFLGYVCVYQGAEDLKEQDWVKVTARVEKEYWAEYGGEGPVLHASSVIKTKAPKDQVISFV